MSKQYLPTSYSNLLYYCYYFMDTQYKTVPSIVSLWRICSTQLDSNYFIGYGLKIIYQHEAVLTTVLLLFNLLCNLLYFSILWTVDLR